jgi:hypothetical protein
VLSDIFPFYRNFEYPKAVGGKPKYFDYLRAAEAPFANDFSCLLRAFYLQVYLQEKPS